MIQPGKRLPTVDKGLAAVVDPGKTTQMRGSQRENGVHQIFVLLCKLWYFMDPDVVIADC